MGYVTPKKGVAFIYYVSLVDQSNTKLFKSNPTLAAGDFTISKDGGSFANLTNLPTVTPAAGRIVQVSLTATEMNADNVIVVASDVAGAEWCDLTMSIQPGAYQTDDLLPSASYTAPPTATAIRTEIDSNSTKLDVAVSTRNSVAPDNTSISAIKNKTDNLPNDPASNTQVNTRLATASYTTPPTVVQVRTEMDSNSTKLANLDATISSRSTYAGGAVASVAAPVTVGTNNDKTGYALTSGEHTAIASDAQTGMTAQGYSSTRAGYLDTLSGLVAAIWSAVTRTLTAAADPLEATVPGAYASGTAGHALGTLPHLADIVNAISSNATTITLLSPLSAQSVLTLIYGDDYKNADGRALTWSSAAWPVLTGSTARWSGKTNGSVVQVTGTVLDASSVRIDLTAAQTAALGVAGQTARGAYDVQATLADGSVVTLVRGALIVLPDVR